MHRFLIVTLCSVYCGLSVSAQTDTLGSPQELGVSDQARVISVVDGDTVVLADGREVRLTGIQAPKLPLSRPNFKTWPLAPAAKTALESLSLDRAVTLHLDSNGQDRYRRILAHVVTADGIWLQGEMVARGMARVYTFPDNRRLGEALNKIEREARAAQKGIWGLDYYAIRSSDPAGLEKDLGTFQLVEGQVTETARVRNWTYLNFGADYRTDFTISINRTHWRAFDDAGFDLLALEGKSVRVRGWIKDFNGPLIEATHPEQIEILSD